MRSVYLVAYDVGDDRRRNRLYKKLQGYGEALQYSLFRCTLTPYERSKMRMDLWALIDHATDRLLIVDLGPEDGRGRSVLEVFGNPLVDRANHGDLLII